MGQTNFKDLLTKRVENGEIDVDVLLEVINSSKNPDVALDMLRGVYQEPHFHKVVTGDSDDELVFHSYNKWTEVVRFTHNNGEDKGACLGYVWAELKPRLLTLEEFDKFYPPGNFWFIDYEAYLNAQ